MSFTRKTILSLLIANCELLIVNCEFSIIPQYPIHQNNHIGDIHLAVVIQVV